MERKNMVLLTVIAAATLLVAMVGATFAFFTATVQDSRTGDNGQGETNITAGSVANKTIVANIESTAGKFIATDIYPGHMEVAGLSVQADNSEGSVNSTTDIAIKYTVTQNDFQANEIKVTLYRAEQKFDEISQNASGNGNDYFGCVHKSELTTTGDYEDGSTPTTGTTKFYESCEKSYDDLEQDGSMSKVGTEQLLKNGASTVEFEDKIVANQSATTTAYYYFVLEFVDDKQSTTAEEDTAQNASMNAVLNGTITVEPA